MRRFRWAPTPSGPLHLGNLFSVLLTWLEAREAEGEILLRIDDLDLTRARSQFIEEIFYVLDELNLDWQLGPRSVDDFRINFSQQHRQREYARAFQMAFEVAPELFFACRCSRKQLAPGLPYPGTCRDLKIPIILDGSVAIRLRAERLMGASDRLGDVVILRKERLFSYQWVSVQEDLHWQITDIHRGEDLRTSSELQSALAAELARRGLEQYAAFAKIRWVHHPLLLNGDRKLSKSDGAQAVREWLPDRRRIFGAFLYWIGWRESPVVCNSQELLQYYRDQRSRGRELRFSGDLQISQLSC